jgi:PAS domain S-box-containing protein
MENSPIYVFFKDSDIRAIRLSRNFEQMIGRPIEEIIGKTMDELFPSDLAKSMIEDDKRVLNNREIVAVDEELNGRYFTTIKFPILIDGEPRTCRVYN